MHSRVLKRRRLRIEDVIPWIGGLIALAAAMLLDVPSDPHKWHAAIVWSICAFTCILLFGRSRWSWRGFWLLGAAFLVIHLFAMWLLFGKLITPNRHIGTLYVAPIGFVEGIYILGLIGSLMGWDSKCNKKTR